MPHLHLPLQSGSDIVLRRMARRCKVQSFAQLVEKAHQLVPTEIKKQRSRSLHDLARSMKLRTYQKFLDQEFPVLWESPNKSRLSATIFGYTPNYLRVATDACSNLENSIKNVRINKIDDSGDYASAVLVD